MRRFWTISAVSLVTLPLLMAQAPVPPGPTVTLTLGPRHGHVTPHREGCTHTGGGNIDVALSKEGDTVTVTMTGVAVATGAPCCPAAATLAFDLSQEFEVTFEKPDVKAAKLTLEGRVIGLLRSHCKGGGSAGESDGCASVNCGSVEIVTLCVPSHSVAGGDNLSINDREGPLTVPIAPGKYTLCQRFQIGAHHSKAILPCKAASAEFAPDPALDPLWISYWEPFHGAAKKDFGFQMTLKVAPEEAKEGNGKEKAKDGGAEKVPPPKAEEKP